MGYLIRLDSLPLSIRDTRWPIDHFTSNFPEVLGRPKHAFPHLCFVFESTSLTHVGVVLRKGDSNSSFTYKLKVSHPSSIGSPLPANDLRTKLHGSHIKSVDKALTASNGTLTEAADANLVEALKALRPDFADRLDWLRDVRAHHVQSPAADRFHLGKDAIRGGLRIGGFPTDRLDEWVLPDDPEETVLGGIKVADYEVDLIEHDSRVLPGFTPAPSTRTGVRVFRDGDRRMEVTSINANPQEGRTGADLLYYHHTTRSMILVQYKRLVDNKTVRVDERLRKQLDRMASLQKLNRAPERHADWRLGSDFCFVKLCRTNTPTGVIDPNNAELLPGLYLPLSFLNLALEDDRVLGPQDGVYLGYEQVERHLDNTTFLQLAREGWIGSSGADMKMIGQVANGSLELGNDVHLALDFSSETQKERQRRTRAQRSRRQQPPPDQTTLF